MWRFPRTGPRTTGALASAVVLLLTSCGSDSASDPPDPEAGASATARSPYLVRDRHLARLWLTFDRTGVGYDGTPVFKDAAGFDHTARVEAAEDGGVDLAPGPEGRGSGVLFPPLCEDEPECPRAMLVVKDSARFDPGASDFTFGASVSLGSDQTTTGSNVVQKGRYGDPGGQWKLQVDTLEGMPSCVVRGTRQLITVRSPIPIADGRWHLVECFKDDAGLEIRVDGAARRKNGNVGTVDNDADIRIGSSGVTEGDDQFHGALDDVYLIVGNSRSG